MIFHQSVTKRCSTASTAKPKNALSRFKSLNGSEKIDNHREN